VIDLTAIENQTLHAEPFEWAFMQDLFSPSDASSLVKTFPRDNCKSVKGSDGERAWEYHARALIHLGVNEISAPQGLSEPWRRLAGGLLSPSYRTAMSRLTGRDLTSAPMEAYICHYGAGSFQEPHRDLPEKICTHVFYFNDSWDDAHGGCLNILRSRNPADVFAQITPIVGQSAILVRSEQSWHSVSRIPDGCRRSRRSMNVIFYHPGAISTMWPPGDMTPVHPYASDEDEEMPSIWRRLLGRFGKAT
jgi:hypothetical protein